MAELDTFGLVVLCVSVAGLAAILSVRIGERIRVPPPALFLVGAALVSDLIPGLGRLDITTVQDVVTAALVLILFDGGMHVGLKRFRSASGTVIWVGVAGTAVTAAAVATLAHVALGLDWQLAMILGVALAPTDPAVVFSVLGRREVVGRSGTVLEGESGANDPVGIAVMVAVLATTGSQGVARVAEGALEFARQMAVGAGIGVLGGLALMWLMRRVSLPGEGLYPLRTLVFAGVVYGAATVLSGSGFLAVFVAGIIIGDENAPYKREVERFHSAAGRIAEIVVFVVLGLTISLSDLVALDALWPGLLVAVTLTFLIRPLLVGLLLVPVDLRWGERLFVLWSGLKGAVPILLATFAFTSGLDGARRIYEIVFVVVAFSVIVQGSLVPTVARWANIPMREAEPEPWALGMRFQRRPGAVHRYRVQPGSPADGCAIGDLALGEGVWISLINRSGDALPVDSETVLAAGDEVLTLGRAEGNDGRPEGVFEARQR